MSAHFSVNWQNNLLQTTKSGHFKRPTQIKTGALDWSARSLFAEVTDVWLQMHFPQSKKRFDSEVALVQSAVRCEYSELHSGVFHYSVLLVMMVTGR